MITLLNMTVNINTASIGFCVPVSHLSPVQPGAHRHAFIPLHVPPLRQGIVQLTAVRTLFSR